MSYHSCRGTWKVSMTHIKIQIASLVNFLMNKVSVSVYVFDLLVKIIIYIIKL